MQYKVYEKENIGKVSLFPTYAKTQKEIKEIAKSFKNPIIERKIGCRWFPL